MRKRFPAAEILVYDNYNALAVGFGPASGKMSDIVFSIAFYPRWITLFFMHGAGLQDSKGRLKGSGSMVRHIVLEDGLETLQAAEDLLTLAVASSGVELVKGPKGKLVIKSISAKQRPRVPLPKKATRKTSPAKRKIAP
jgi:hypothetical protein